MEEETRKAWTKVSRTSEDEENERSRGFIQGKENDIRRLKSIVRLIEVKS